MADQPLSVQERLQQTWNRLPSSYRRASEVPMTTEQLMEDIERYTRDRACRHPRELALTLQLAASTRWGHSIAMVQVLKEMYQPPASNPPDEETGPCNHTGALGAVLGAPVDDSWDELLDTVRQLKATAPLPTAPAPVSEGGRSITDKFKLDIPEFGSTTKYEEYRPALRNFMHTVELEPRLIRPAIFAIKAKWKGVRLSRFSDEIDATDLLRPNAANPVWETTRDYLLEWLDSKFMDPNHFVNAQKEWLTLPTHIRKQDYASANDFYLAFESLLFKYNASCLRAGKPLPTEGQIRELFILALPDTITEQARLLRENFDSDPYRTHRNLLAKIWLQNRTLHHSNVPANIRMGKRQREEESDDEEAAARAAPRRGNFVQKGHLPFKDAPATNKGPAGYYEGMTREEQSSAKARRERLRRDHICRVCRHPKSAHQDFSAYEPFTSWDGPERAVVRWVPSSGEENNQKEETPDVKEENT